MSCWSGMGWGGGARVDGEGWLLGSRISAVFLILSLSHSRSRLSVSLWICASALHFCVYIPLSNVILGVQLRSSRVCVGERASGQVAELTRAALASGQGRRAYGAGWRCERR
ncbi:hypothetical protein VTO73DRAFT_7183 [Trametes versicolor]